MSTAEAPSLLRLLFVWLKIGAQSFGGGASTLALIHGAFVEEQGWVSEAEFSRQYALSSMTPGMKLLALAILIGGRLAGAVGVAVSLAGLLVPSVTITILMTALYTRVQGQAVVGAAIGGVIPAALGLGLSTMYRVATPLLTASRKDGRASLLLSIFVLAGSALALAVWHLPVILILAAAGFLGAVSSLYRRPAPERSGCAR